MDNDDIIHGRYKIIEIIGQGKFGTVFKAQDSITEEMVAIKRELSETQYSSIKHETKIMTYLFQNKFRKLPFVYWYGRQNKWQYLVMSFYDCSLEDYYKLLMNEKNICKFDDFSLIQLNNSCTLDLSSIISNLFLKCIHILENIHKLYVLHRDIKPTNFMIKDNEIYLIDFGLSTFWLDSEGEHILNVTQNTITGTPKYVSYYNHIGNTLSRRDDLISLGYMIIYFMYGYLPWQKMAQENNLIYEMKNYTNVLDFLKNETPINETLPSSKMYYYMEYCYSLEFNEIPNYNLLKKVVLL